jgi:hypothetical protein
MDLVSESRIADEFEGWDENQVFELTNGQKWQQVQYKYRYRYMYMPRVKIWRDGSKYLLDVEGMDEMLEVRRIE